MGTKLIKDGGLRGSKQEAEVDGMNTVPNAMETHKAKLLQILEDALGIEAIETAFCGMIVHNENDEDKDVKEIFQQVFKPFWAAVPVDAREQLLLDFVSFIYNENNPRRIDLAFGLLGSLVETSLLPSRLLCDAILKTPHLSFHKEAMWCKTFQLLLRIIGGVDYKGCRDILSLVFQRFQNIPFSSDAVYTARIEACVKVVRYILDRNACLLPAYFVINEIYKTFPEGKVKPHWAIAKLLSDFIETFRPLAHMVSVIGRPTLLPVIGHPGSSITVWKLDPNTLSFPLKGLLPYDKELLKPQTKLLQYVIAQPYSRDVICTMLGLNKQQKQRCPALEELLVDLIVVAMEKSEENDVSMIETGCQLLWHHLSSHLIFFVLFQFASFPHMVLSLYSKLNGRNLKKGRDHLMWVLLQFISGSIQKNPLSDFKPVMKLFDLLYPEKQPLPLPDITVADSVNSLAMACIWVHLAKKAQTENVTWKPAVPHILKDQLEYIQMSSRTAASSFNMSNYKIPLLCNAYSTNTDLFTVPMAVLVEMCYGNNKNTTQLPGPSNTLAAGPTVPCPMSLLDSLTVHAKMSLIHSIVNRIIKLGNSQTSLALAPALVETYSRLLVYMEIESLGIKGFISSLLPNVFKSHAWGILHTLLEMFSYRLHHIQPHYRVTLLSHLHSLAAVPHTNQNQLHLCVESTALRLITGLGSSEVQPQLARFNTEPKQLLSAESEELNRTLVLTIARSMHITYAESNANWYEGILRSLITNTPHNWASHTLACFPAPLRQFYQQNPCPQESKQDLRQRVEDEYRRWKSMTTENEILNHFADPSSTNVFICILWKMLLESGRLSPACHKVLERLGARALSAHVRVFADYLVYELSKSVGGKHINKCIAHLNDLIWKYNVVTLDRLVLCLALRSHEGSEAQVCFFIIQLLLLKPHDLRLRVNAFIRENSPQHWLQHEWHQKHMAYHTSYPERFYFEGLLESAGSSVPTVQYLPIYFGNVCLRFLPVFDIVIQRFVELAPVHTSLDCLLDHLGCLYKFHDRPVTFLYNTLHYYEHCLRDKPSLKKKLVGAIIGAQKDVHPTGWCLSKGYLDYLSNSEETPWTPDMEYYCNVIGRLVDTISGKSPPPFPACDWRFNEFANPVAHALHVTWVELMALPVTGPEVGDALFDVIFKGSYVTHDMGIRDNIMEWINAVGLVLSSLPEPYWSKVYEKITVVLVNDLSARDASVENLARSSPFPYSFLEFATNVAMHSETSADHVLATTHAFWHHASIGQLCQVPQFIRERVSPLTTNEAQFMYVCHLVGPFLQRFLHERPRCLQEIVIELYRLLEKVNGDVQHLHYIDTICDFLYHIKYMFIGDIIKDEILKIIPKLRQSLQIRLRFMTQGVKREENA
ncbi:mediator of RNA polymerase II transcription subunit 23-like [Montipora capricornis]|uniref:mediator of RNA polymerase II transcription subunit 23-like n=1 Tax=Montipora capricornis TaxID=246305 RepID=UPI0035F17D22